MRFGTLTLLLLASPLCAADTIDVKRAVQQAEAVSKAVLDGEFERMVDRLHPRLVELMGGREKMIEQSRKLMKMLRDQGVTFKSNTLGKPGEPVIDGKTAYLVIPTTLELEQEGRRVVTESYLLGTTTDNGKSWYFVDGAGMDQPRMREQIFPKLPAGLKLPAKKPPVIPKD